MHLDSKIPLNSHPLLKSGHLSYKSTLFIEESVAGLDINVCPIPVKTDVGQVDLVSPLSDGTSEQMTVLPFESYFLW